MAKKKNKYRDVTITPSQGGQLMARTSPVSAKAENYITKRDWRRHLDQEERREGYDYFGDFTGETNTGSQPFPTADEINLIHMARSPSGKTAIIVGSKTTLYQFYSLDFEYISQIAANSPDPGGNYVDGDGTDPYFAEYDWQVIGSGFSADGCRWEAVNLNGYTVFNNGVDLPVVYRLEWAESEPLTELRDQGIARVGTISAFNNVLMLGDVEQIYTQDISTWMNGSAPYGNYTGSTNRFQYRLMWASNNEPQRFAANITCSATSGSNQVTMDWPSQSFKQGDSVTIFGAGINSGNLTTTISSISGTTVTLGTQASTTPSSSSIQRADAVGSIVGYDDLQDDASGILKMAELQGQLVIYKDTSIFLASYTGIVDMPFTMVRLGIPTNKALFYKHTLVPVLGLYHIYAGRNAFYKLDLQTRIPIEVAKMDLCSNLFFDNPSVSIASTCDIFATDNSLTKEVWFCHPSSTSDHAICYDYRYDTVSTTSINLSAASAVKRPTLNLVPVETEDWFVMGNSAGTLLLYGKVDNALPQWGNSMEVHYRRSNRTFIAGSSSASSTTFTASADPGSSLAVGDGVTVYGAATNGLDLTTTVTNISGTTITLNDQAITSSAKGMQRHHVLSTEPTEGYSSTIKSGLIDFGIGHDEKSMRSYVPHLSEVGSSGYTVNIYSARNEHDTPTSIVSHAVTDPNENLISMYYKNHFFQDELKVSGKDNPAKLHARTFEVDKSSSSSTTRRDNN